MSTALDEVCKDLNLTDEAQSQRERLAKKIIALAQHGERSAAVLRDRVLKELIYGGGKRHPDPRHLPGESGGPPSDCRRARKRRNNSAGAAGDARRHNLHSG